MDDALVAELREEAAGSLRAVGTYDHEGYRVHFLREDVETALGDADLEAIREGAVLDTLERDYYERLFSTAGAFEATIRQFERALVVEVPTGEGAGVLVSVDRDLEGSIRAVVDRCRAAGE